MKLVVGLGNPGPDYANTRHNVGFRIVECLAARCGIGLDRERFGGRFGSGRWQGIELALLEPQTYMNRSGSAAAAAVAGLPVTDPAQDLLVAFDDVDLPLGQVRLRAGGGAGGHRGLTDVIAQLGTRAIPRLRFGVGRPPPGVSTTDHVLAPFTPDEEAVLPPAVARAAQALEAALRDGLDRAMTQYNAPAAEG